MELTREKEFVNQYHYDARNLEWEKENGTPETNFEVTFQLAERDEEAVRTSVVAVLQFMVVRDEFVISGAVPQLVHIKDRLVASPKDCSQEAVHDLAAPLLVMVRRLAYEVTEISLARPGLNLEFNSFCH